VRPGSFSALEPGLAALQTLPKTSGSLNAEALPVPQGEETGAKRKKQHHGMTSN